MMMLNTLTTTSKNKIPLWCHLMRGLAAVLLLGGLGSPAMAESISVNSTFIDANQLGRCDNFIGVNVPGVGCFRGADGVRRNWADANIHCAEQGAGYVLPSQDQLSALYNAYPNNQISTGWGWPTSYIYLSSTPATVGAHFGVFLNTGSIDDVTDTDAHYATCVRAP